MAKPRKPKNEDPKPENSGAVVRRQKLCLSIDMDKRQVYGYTELEIAVPEIGIVGLHAENLGIMRVSVDGEPADFEYYPNQQLENEKRWSSVMSPSSAADVAASLYMSALEKELIPNLLINCCKAFKNGYEQQDQTATENGIQSSGDTKQNVRLIRIDYWVEKGESGIHFKDNVLHTDNQIRRARCWFPCIDDTSQQCCYDLEFTVAHHLVAVSNGSLLYQVLSKDNPPRKTYVYKLEIPVAARWISLAVAPFAILPDHGVSLISHMCLQLNLPELRNTVEFFHNAFSCYKDYLSVDFPFDSYKQVFIEPDMAVSSLISGASLSILSTQLLFDEKIIDQTIDTRIKLAYALARQWFGVYITPESANDEWLVDGLAGYLTDLFIKKHLGNNEARYRRYKANCAVCKADDGGVTALSNTTSCKDLYGTHCIGFYGKIRSWKSVAILQMLEKQMGPESFRKVLQTIVSRAQDKTRALRSLSTKEFRHFANKVGNLERPFLKEFFPRWVGSYGCPVLRMGFSYNKRKNMVELAVFRECTASSNSSVPILNTNSESENRDGEIGWPGMMSIRVYELDGMYDHPILPMAGEPWQLLEIQCHSRLAVRRFQKPKKGAKADGSDDNVDVVPALDMRSSTETPLIWMRADPEMEYLAKIRFNQPVQMWINQLEKDKDVIAQAQAIENLEALPRLPFSVVNALHNFLSDSKAYWRVRIEAAFALASTASEETEWAGLLNLVTFYKSRRFDLNIGLPKPNDFHDFSEYFVLEAIPHAVATVRAEDKKSPREAVEFVLQLLKYNDNSGNPYSDVFWLAALVQSVGELEFGQQSILLLSSLLKRIDRLLQFDRLMPSYNGILTISCIQTLTQIALKLSEFIPLDRVIALIKPFQDLKAMWNIRVEASRALLDLEYYCKGIDAALLLFVKFLEEEPSLRGQLKLGVHAIRLCQMRSRSNPDSEINIRTLVALLHVLDGRTAFNNVYLRHHLFCVFQILAGRPPTLFGVPRENRMLQIVDADICNVPKDIFDVLDSEIRPLAPCGEVRKDMQSTLAIPEVPTESCTAVPEEGAEIPEQPPAEIDNKPPVEIAKVPPDIETPNRVPKELDSASVGQDRKKPVVKIRVKQSSATSKAETDNQTTERSLGHNELDHGASSSVSVDAPQRNFTETVSTNNYNVEEANSWHDVGSRMTASIGSAKLVNDGEEVGKDLLCTADSSLVYSQYRPEDPSSCSIFKGNSIATEAQNFASLQSLSVPRVDLDGGADISKHKKEKKKDKEKIRKRENHPGRSEDLEYLERKRLKKEKKRKEKEIAKLLLSAANVPKVDLSIQKEGNAAVQSGTIPLTSKSEPNEAKAVTGGKDKKPAGFGGTSNTPKFRIKIKNRTLNK